MSAQARGYNLDSGGSCGFTRTTDLTHTDPLLSPLADNGGPTPTMALRPGSPAFDRGGTAANGCPATDQRGVARPQGPTATSGPTNMFPERRLRASVGRAVKIPVPDTAPEPRWPGAASGGGQ
jgi:hypothetical protein